MTVPACPACNNRFSLMEERAAAVIATVSFRGEDQAATRPGGWLHRAKESDAALAQFIGSRVNKDGFFQVDHEVKDTLATVMAKTAVGLLFHEFGRIVTLESITLAGLEHARNILPEAFLEMHRQEGHGFAEVTPSGRELERQIQALLGLRPRHSAIWKIYVPGYFEYAFIRCSDQTMLCGMKVHDALTGVVRCPWPSRAGPRRRGAPPRGTGA